jgi:hypothetical protein
LTEPLLTRAQAVEVINEELGIPVTKWMLDTAASRGTGPSPAARMGKRCFLYEKQAVFAWAKSLITPIAA